MASELDQLAEAARGIATVGGANPDVARRAEQLAERLLRNRFNISVVGEFKRGKSTVVNALVGADLLPTGVLPLTAVATEVSFGEPGATVVHRDGERREVGIGELADFVTEARNPGNEKEVEKVEVRTPAELLEPGVVLVDTPGIGSIFRHNDDAATRALLEADGTILVLSADTPLSEQERQLLSALAERAGPTFFLLNKIDHLSPTERDEVRRFVTDAVAGELGRKEPLWCMDARGALAARREGREPSEAEAGDFSGVVAVLRSFIQDDLVTARLDVARRELGRLARSLQDALSLESSALELDAADLAARVGRFEVAADEQRRAYADEATLLERDVAALAGAISQRLFDFARTEPARWEERLGHVSATAPVHRLGLELDVAIEEAVRTGFESFRQAETASAERAWSELAQGMRQRTQERINAIRAAAGELFSIRLPGAAIPEVAEERERYFYLFLHVGTFTEGMARVLRPLLPRSVVRRRALERARRDLAREFDKHAGRARWDIAQRLDAVRQRFEVAMAAELDQAVEAILAAARRAGELAGAAQVEREQRAGQAEAARQAAAVALALTGEP